MRPVPSSNAQNTAMTCTDLVFALAACFCLSVCMLPALAQPKERTGQAQCFSNLRTLGSAFVQWANDHERQFPWRTLEQDGGTWARDRPATVWMEFIQISNHLDSPRILACPSDRAVRPASEFSSNPDRGYFHFNFRDNATSYLIGLDAEFDGPTHIVSGDRNITETTLSGCSSGVATASTMQFNKDVPFPHQWSTDLHRGKGNILRADGSVLQLSNEGLKKAAAQGDDNGSIHMIIP